MYIILIYDVNLIFVKITEEIEGVSKMLNPKVFATMFSPIANIFIGFSKKKRFKTKRTDWKIF